jgi:hypothetical protein
MEKSYKIWFKYTCKHREGYHSLCLLLFQVINSTMAIPPAASKRAQLRSLILCCIIIYIYWNVLVWSMLPFLLDMLFNILLAEYNIYANRQRRRAAGAHQISLSLSHENADKKSGAAIAAIVGYREDPNLFSRALQSYVNADRCRFILVCIDGKCSSATGEESTLTGCPTRKWCGRWRNARNLS